MLELGRAEIKANRFSQMIGLPADIMKGYLLEGEDLGMAIPQEESLFMYESGIIGDKKPFQGMNQDKTGDVPSGLNLDIDEDF